VSYREQLNPAEQALGRLYGMKGQRDAALTHLRASVAELEQLFVVEPSNTNWREQGFRSRFALAEFALQFGVRDEAAAQTSAGCESVRRLLAEDSAVSGRRAGLADCELLMAKVALASGSGGEAATHAEQAVRAANTVRSNDAAGDRYRIARAYRALGDALSADGNSAGARAAWHKALAALPTGRAERPTELDEHATILQRNGRAADAQRIVAALSAMGYKRADPTANSRRGP
jgi:tetratricopeptide (TPR) repeat protein